MPSAASGSLPSLPNLYTAAAAPDTTVWFAAETLLWTAQQHKIGVCPESRPRHNFPEYSLRSWLLPDDVIDDTSNLMRLLRHLQQEACDKRSRGHRRPAPNLRTFPSLFFTRRYKKFPGVDTFGV